jgi:hypothetical protein
MMTGAAACRLSLSSWETQLDRGVSRLFATAMEAMALIIDPRLVHPARRVNQSKN